MHKITLSANQFKMAQQHLARLRLEAYQNHHKYAGEVFQSYVGLWTSLAHSLNLHAYSSADGESYIQEDAPVYTADEDTVI